MNGDKPFFSIVIPINNKEPHVARSISSVLNQTFQDFELLAINDASTDGSVKEVLRFTDHRIRLLHRTKPGPGGYAARNFGIKEAQGEWIAFLDADDEWYPEHLGKMHRLSKDYPDAYLMGCGWTIEDGGRSRQDSYFMLNKERGNHILDTKAYLNACLRMQRPVHTSAACVRASSPMALNLFPAEKGAKRGGDLHAWLKTICWHKQMAWSAHVGAKYYRNAVNMVTKTAPSSPCLLSKAIYKEISSNLNNTEKTLLKKYLNTRLRKGWFYNFRSKNQNFTLLPRIFWNADIKNTLNLLTISILPNFAIKYIIQYKAKK